MSNLTDILRNVAPTIAGVLGTAVGGPLGPLVGIAVKTLGDKLLGKPDATLPEVEAAIAAATPEQLLELKKIDADFKRTALEMGFKEHELDFRYEELSVTDRKDARWRDIAIVQAAGKNQRADLLAYIAIGGLMLFGVTGIIVSVVWPLATGAREICVLMIGYLLKEVSGVYNFEFGASRSERHKDDTIKNIAEGP